MSRLTYKRGRGMLIENNIEYGTLTNVCYQNCVDKLGHLEDIEDELGIDLVTLVKALKNGIWVRIGKKRIVKDEPDGLTKCALENGFQYIKRDGWRLDCIHGLIETKDYGKTWALTREELEK